jgi:hypothetical protein
MIEFDGMVHMGLVVVELGEVEADVEAEAAGPRAASLSVGEGLLPSFENYYCSKNYYYSNPSLLQLQISIFRPMMVSESKKVPKKNTKPEKYEPRACRLNGGETAHPRQFLILLVPSLDDRGSIIRTLKTTSRRPFFGTVIETVRPRYSFFSTLSARDSVVFEVNMNSDVDPSNSRSRLDPFWPAMDLK